MQGTKRGVGGEKQKYFYKRNKSNQQRVKEEVDNIVGSTSSNSLNLVFRDCQNPHNGGRSGVDERRIDDASGSMTFNSLYVDRPNYKDEANFQASSSNYANMAEMESFWATARRHHATLETHAACRSNGGQNATDRHSARSNNLQSTPEIGTYGFGTPGNSTRNSACKRKSCAPVVACSSSYQSGSLHRGGLQESYDGRAVGVSGMSRCSTAIAGCTSDSGVGASTSSSAEATFMGLGVRPSVVAGTLEDLQSPIVLSSTAPHHNCSPSLVGGRTGAPAAPRHSETTSSSTGARERPTLRYSSARNLANCVSSSQLGAAVAAETSVHNQGINYHSLEPMSLAAPLPSNSVFPTIQTNPAAPSSSSTLRPPSHPPSLRSRLQGSIAHTLLPSMSTPGATSSRLSTPFHPSLLAPSVDSLPSAASLLQGSMLSRSSAPGVRERSFSSVAESLLGMPLRGLRLSAGDGAHQPRLVAEGLAEVSHPNYDILLSQLLMLEATLHFGGMGLHDQHSDLRLDVDNMSYEELLALEERIGNVSTGVTAEVVAQKLKRSQYSSLDVVVARFSEECDIKCSICQEEYVEGDELGKIECGHGYHVSCIQQWLMQKNQCPICKAAAFS
ncbi:unnamed protein product [Sphagnum compactum]